MKPTVPASRRRAPLLALGLASILLLLGAMLAPPARAAGSGPQDEQHADIADLSIEELANIDVTSVSRRPERLQDAPASVFVITADDIRRAGSRNLPEALRLAPNLQVARASNADYLISARGLNGNNVSPPNKLLVMIDGRSVYSPLFSGVFWDEPDVMLDDVERIEVISGPGGTLWGVNAVNGVINITTRHAQDTPGDLLTLRATGNGAQAAFRHGTARRDGAWRVYGKVLALAHSDDPAGRPLDDDWTAGQIGARADWTRGPDRFSVNANAWRGGEGRPALGVIAPPDPTIALDDITTHGVNATGRWEHALDDGASLAVQAYYDLRYRQVPPTFGDTVHIADLQLQHTLALLGRHSIVWGGEYRYSWDHVDNSPRVAILPASDKQAWASLFAQDEILLRPDLRLTAGVRYERNPYTGLEFLPNLRLSWRATPAHAFWTAFARTVRAPTRLDVDGYVPGQPPYTLAGGRGVRAETARVLEVGYRGQVGSGLSYSVTAYRNLYDHLRTQDVSPDGGRLVFGNGMTGQAHGIEAWGNVQVSGGWRIAAGMTALHQVFALKPGSNDVDSLSTSGRDPAYSLQLRSSHTLRGGRELELALRHVAALSAPAVAAYTAFDARFGWRLSSGVEVSVFGANLNGGHAEYGLAPFRAEVPRTVGVKVVWQR